MNLKYKILIIALVLLYNSCGLKDNHIHNENEKGHVHKHDSEAIIIPQEKVKDLGISSIIVKKNKFNSVIKVTGEILSAANDSYTIVAPKDGTIKLNNKITIGALVYKGSLVCSVSGANLVGGDTNASASINYKIAKEELDRLTPLYEEKIVTAREYNIAKQNYEKAKLAYRPSGNGNVSVSPITGTVTELYVSDGAFVNMGSPIAVISQNSRLTLRADVPERYYSFLSSINSANIRASYMTRPINLKDLKGKLLSSNRSPAINGYFTVIFEMDNNSKLAAGSFVEVFLLGAEKEGVLSVPIESVSEELGNKYVYIQSDSHSFYKREVQLGNTDGNYVEIISGINDGDHVVTNGVTFVRLAAVSTEIPDGCSHNHK